MRRISRKNLPIGSSLSLSRMLLFPSLLVPGAMLGYGEWAVSDGSGSLLCDRLNDYAASDPKVCEFAGLE